MTTEKEKILCLVVITFLALDYVLLVSSTGGTRIEQLNGPYEFMAKTMALPSLEMAHSILQSTHRYGALIPGFSRWETAFRYQVELYQWILNEVTSDTEKKTKYSLFILLDVGFLSFYYADVLLKQARMYRHVTRENLNKEELTTLSNDLHLVATLLRFNGMYVPYNAIFQAIKERIIITDPDIMENAIAAFKKWMTIQHAQILQEVNRFQNMQIRKAEGKKVTFSENQKTEDEKESVALLGNQKTEAKGKKVTFLENQKTEAEGKKVTFSENQETDIYNLSVNITFPNYETDENAEVLLKRAKELPNGYEDNEYLKILMDINVFFKNYLKDYGGTVPKFPSIFNDAKNLTIIKTLKENKLMEFGNYKERSVFIGIIQKMREMKI